MIISRTTVARTGNRQCDGDTFTGWEDIGYNFLVGEDGRVYEGRGWTTLPAHSPVYNYFSHGTCIMGNFMTVAPDQPALNATQAWIQCGVDLVSVVQYLAVVFVLPLRQQSSRVFFRVI